MFLLVLCFFFFKQKTAYEMRISDWSSDVCSSDLRQDFLGKVHDLHPADAKAIDKAIARWNEKRDEAAALILNAATESPSARLINQLNQIERASCRERVCQYV